MRRFGVDILAYDGMRLYDFAIAREVFGDRPEMLSTGFDVVVVGRTGSITTDEGPTVACIRMREHARKPDIIVVPGSERRMGEIGTQEIDWLRAHAADPEILVIGLCTGAFVLAEAGLLDGKHATTHWRFAELLASRFPEIIGETNGLYARDGNIWTSAGVSAGVDALLAAVESIAGAATADIIARSMVTPPRRQGSQAQFAPNPTRSVVHPFASLAVAIQNDPGRDWTVGELARHSNMSTRTFHRRFKEIMGVAPGKWVTGIRLQEARSLLETTTLTIERIAHRAGFGNADHFRQHFTSRFRLTPSAYRATMGHQPPTP
ncbi:GlxA family transcriptional regulator [Paeniglutamicibacter sp. MACA_103]|uniref:GlxA family transcriptional regulator n=1 Tax=Paeniglutamicibacter sp. MACA_103 TaxID=3377337 RepID=UPI003895664B